MRKFASIVVVLGFTLLALAGCGSGSSGCDKLTGGTGTTGTGCTTTTNPTQTPATVTVSTTAANLPGDGSASATITAVVTDSTGAAVSGVTVTFSTSAGTLSASTGTTGSTGQATTSLTASGVATGTAITVTATAGTVSGKTTVTVATTSTVASLTVSTSVGSIPSDGSSSAAITVLAKDAKNNALSAIPVTLSASGGTLSGATTSTSANGTITAVLSGSGATAGSVITITATSGTVTGKATINVVATQQAITLLTSSPQLPSANTKSATITAIVQGSNNQLLAGVPVTFQASSGAIAAVQTTAGATANVPAGTTDANGTALATLTTPGNPTNRVITVTALAGSASATVTVTVSGTTLSVSGPTSLVQNAQGNYSVSLTDSGGNAISAQAVTLASSNNNTLTPATVTTSSTGTAPFALTAVNSGNDTITATWLGQSSTETVAVSNQNFSITAPAASTPPLSIVVGQSQAVTISWAASGAPVQSGTVDLTTSRGTLSVPSASVSNGALSVPVTISSTTAGPAIISATALDGTGKTVATAQVVVDFIATVPHSVSVQASPSTVAIKGQSTLTATVIDLTGNPVQNTTVDFTLTDSTGGSLSAPTAVTNAQGVASITYTASTGSSAPNGVIITATVPGTSPSITNTTTLTVGGQTVHLSFGTGNQIVEYSTTQYEMPYTVQAADASNNGISNVTVTFSLQDVSYAPGVMALNALKVWVPQYSVPSPNFCPGPTTVQEYNGVINPTPPPAGVTPVATQIPGAVATTDVGSAITGTGGSATVNLIYPKDHAYWVGVALTATATVAGTQNSATASFILPGVAADYSVPTVSPPGATSPYGQSTTCY
jgi:Bacterial Ig-like domain (group 1)